MTSIRQFLAVSAALTLLFLMAALPIVPELLYVKVALSGISAGIAVYMWLDRPRLHGSVLLWLAVTVCAGIASGCIGLVSRAPGAMNGLQVYAFWPLVYGALLTLFYRWRYLVFVEYVLLASLITVSGYGLVLIAVTAGVLPNAFYVPILDQGQAVGFYGEYSRVNLYGLNSFPFLLPYCLVSALQGGGRAPARVVLRWLAVMLGIAFTLVSGRRGLMLSVLLAPLLVLLLCRSHRQVAKLTVAGIAIAIVFVVEVRVIGENFGVTLPGIVRSVVSGFEFQSSVDAGASPRLAQFEELAGEFYEHPVLGAGLGAVAPGVIRSYGMPWSYELSYSALLFQTGLLGAGIYLGLIVWIYWAGLRVVRRTPFLAPIMSAHLAGLTGILITNATNPILMRFDGLWAVFLPLGVINYALLRERRIPLGPAARLPVAPEGSRMERSAILPHELWFVGAIKGFSGWP